MTTEHEYKYEYIVKGIRPGTTKKVTLNSGFITEEDAMRYYKRRVHEGCTDVTIETLEKYK